MIARLRWPKLDITATLNDNETWTVEPSLPYIARLLRERYAEFKTEAGPADGAKIAYAVNRLVESLKPTKVERDFRRFDVADPELDY